MLGFGLLKSPGDGEPVGNTKISLISSSRK